MPCFVGSFWLGLVGVFQKIFDYSSNVFSVGFLFVWLFCFVVDFYFPCLFLQGNHTIISI